MVNAEGVQGGPPTVTVMSILSEAGVGRSISREGVRKGVVGGEGRKEGSGVHESLESVGPRPDCRESRVRDDSAGGRGTSEALVGRVEGHLGPRRQVQSRPPRRVEEGGRARE